MVKKEAVGVVISTFEGPSPSNLSFVVTSEEAVPVRKDQFVSIPFEDGELIARITNLRKTNKYYERAESVKHYGEKAGMSNLFPIDSWQYLIADALPLGVYKDRIARPTFPVSPGNKVYIVDDAVLGNFLGLEKGGLNIGKVEHHNLDAEISLTSMLRKHLAILSISGGGKSYLTSVLLEELLDRKKNEGRIGVIVFDIHGEYTGFADGLYQEKVGIIDASRIKIPIPKLRISDFFSMMPSLTEAQERELYRIMKPLWDDHWKNANTFDLKEIIEAVEASEETQDATKNALIGKLRKLKNMRLFGPHAEPPIDKLISPGIATIIDLSKIESHMAKQIIVYYLSKELFALRKKGKVPPYLEVVEEAHNFIPEGVSRDRAIARGILETVAREGRKFYASLCLISQRPKRLDNTILSQCNSQIILRITNPYDLKHISESCEGITTDTSNSITTLRVGEAVIIGEAVRHPVFIKVRTRKSPEPAHSTNMEEAAKIFEEKNKNDLADARAFL